MFLQDSDWIEARPASMPLSFNYAFDTVVHAIRTLFSTYVRAHMLKLSQKQN